jgi:mannose-6-phosphate isomerase-like protein (cupin superfamily)
MRRHTVHVAPFSRPAGAGPTLDVLGVIHIYKATGAETGGCFSLWEAIIPPGAGAPPHTHRHEDESFYVLSGELLIDAEGEPVPLRIGPGGFFFGARGRRHAFRNVGAEPARALVLSTPSVGLDQMFVEFDAAKAGTPEIEKLAAIAAKHGVTIAQPTG